MQYESAAAKLKTLGQTHLLRHWDELTLEQQEQLLAQIEAINPIVLQQHPSSPVHPFTPFSRYQVGTTAENRQLGEEAIAQGKVACVILAGGQGTRLGYDGPKGIYPIPGVEKTLFQLFAEQVKGPLAIMTSPKNDAVTRDYWENHHHFGVKDVSFFPQNQLPLTDLEGQLFLESADSIAFGPNGNGAVYKGLKASGILDRWVSMGIKTIQIIQIDNALARPFDTDVIGYHLSKGADVTLKCTKRKDPSEHVGILVESNGGVDVLEYSELDEPVAGDFLANLSIMFFSIDFFQKCALLNLPLHQALKKSAYWDEDSGEQKQPQSPNCYKFEFFAFDVLPHASHVEAVECPRETCFAPLKNATGPDSPATVQHALESCSKELK